MMHHENYFVDKNLDFSIGIEMKKKRIDNSNWFLNWYQIIKKDCNPDWAIHEFYPATAQVPFKVEI